MINYERKEYKHVVAPIGVQTSGQLQMLLEKHTGMFMPTYVDLRSKRRLL